MAILSRRRIPLAILLLYEQFIHLTKITLRHNTQFLSNQQHAYQSFLSHVLVLFRLQYCGILGEFQMKIELYTIYKSILTQMYVFLVLFTFF